jgi:CDP-glucose 4,6-dehydratase
MGEWQSTLDHRLMPSSLAEFYQGKKILVTGHTGFKGGWLTVWLRLMGSEVCGFSLPPETTPNLFTVARVEDGIVTVMGDIRDQEAVAATFRQFEPEIVIHCAAQALVRRSYHAPVETYATNVMGTVHVLEAARQTPSVRVLVVVTSDKCYENREWERGYCESDAMGGFDPYSSSKGAAELVTGAYRRSFFNENDGLAVASARAGNVIGGGDWSEDRLVPDIAKGIMSGRPILIRRPKSVRPWQHVLEPLRGYLLLAQRLWDQQQEYAEAWNFGPIDNDAIAVGELAERMIANWGEGEMNIQPDSDALHEAQMLRLDCRKAAERLGWTPRLELQRAVEWTVEWYRQYYRNPGSARMLTETQVKRYMQFVNI